MIRYSFILFACLISQTVIALDRQKYFGIDSGLTVTKTSSISNNRAALSDADESFYDNADPGNEPNHNPRVVMRKRSKSFYGNWYVGYKLADRVAFEYGMFAINPIHKKPAVSVKAYGLHAGFIFPLEVINRVELFPGLAISYSNIDINHALKGHQSINHREAGLIPRITFGVQIKIADRFKLRTSLIWHNMSGVYSDNMIVRNVYNIGIGLHYIFDNKDM